MCMRFRNSSDRRGFRAVRGIARSLRQVTQGPSSRRYRRMETIAREASTSVTTRKANRLRAQEHVGVDDSNALNVRIIDL